MVIASAGVFVRLIVDELCETGDDSRIRGTRLAAVPLLADWIGRFDAIWSVGSGRGSVLES